MREGARQVGPGARKKAVTGALCALAPIETRRWFLWCPKCKRRRLHEVKCYERYPPHVRCLKCRKGGTLGP